MVVIHPDRFLPSEFISQVESELKELGVGAVIVNAPLLMYLVDLYTVWSDHERY